MRMRQRKSAQSRGRRAVLCATVTQRQATGPRESRKNSVMASRKIVFALLAAVLIAAGLPGLERAAAANFLVLQKSPATPPPPPPTFCMDKKDQGYFSDARTMTRCKANAATARFYCPAGCTAVLGGGAICNGS
jgi:hypothetical protein